FPLTYTSSATTSPIARVSVDWGDGQTQTINGQPSAIAHQFRNPGSFVVLVTAVDTFGDPSTATAAVIVGQQPRPTVVITPPTTAPTAGSATTFTIAVTAVAGTTI